MSIIFQLFSAEDLQKLDQDELLKLSAEIKAVLAESGLSKEGKLHLNLSPKVGLDNESPHDLRSDPKWKPLIEESLLKRFYEVSHQMKTPPLDLSKQSFNFEKLITERNDEAAQAKEKLILEWAISCELNHMEFYFALLKAKEGVENFYKKYPKAKEKLLTEKQRQAKDLAAEKVRTKDPDSVYSPFNPRHPGYKQYSDVSGAGPETAGSTSSSSC